MELAVDVAPAPDRQADGDSLRAPALQVVIRINGRLTGWHVDLLHRLARRPDMELCVDARPGPDGDLPTAAMLRTAESVLLSGLPQESLSDPMPWRAMNRFPTAPRAGADLIIDLTGCADDAGTTPVWTVTFDGTPGLAALQRCLLDGRTPLVEIREQARIVAAARIGTETGGILRSALDDSLARVSTLILATLSGAVASALPALPDAEPSSPRSSRSVVRFAAKALLRAATHPLYRACFRAPHWRTGWRRLDGPDLFDLQAHPASGWRTMADDGSRFYADPFPLEHQGKLTLFVEEFPHATGKGVISAVAFGPDGPLGRPVPVLEQPTHLSYPFVFVHDGEVWMIPESGAAGTVDLYRSTAFPGGWVKEKTLLSGLVASDATLTRHAGLWWMFATVRDGGGSFSDALHLWFAHDLLGPWTPHPRNPVLIDIASARPAGRMIRRGAALLRPVQDCRAGYGAALGIARVTRLDTDGFEQVVESFIGPGPLWKGRRLHTLNRAGGFEFIDGSALSPRWTGSAP